MPAKGGISGGSEHAHARGSAGPWASALREAFPDVEWLDSDLQLGDGRTVDWVGIDPSGRVVFASRCGGDDEDTVLSALDALVFFERHRSVLGRHLRTPRVRAGLEPILALVADSFSERLLARLAGLGSRSLCLFEFRELTSAGGQRGYLVPIAPSFGHAHASTQRGPEAFLDALPAELRDVGLLAVQRISRIDDHLAASAGDRSLSWRLGETLLCSIAQIDVALEGQVHPDGAPRVLGAPAQVEAFVDQVLGRYVALLGGEPATPPSDSPLLVTVDAGMTLSPEEIAAFRQSG